MDITIHHHGSPHTIHLPSPSSTLSDLSESIASTLHIPPENQKLLISPKPGMQKPPFPPTPLSSLLPSPSTPRTKITLFGTPTSAIDALNAQGEDSKRRSEARAHALATARHELQKDRAKTANRSPGGVHTLSSTSSSTNYTFHRIEPLPYLPHPERSTQFLERLRDDPGIRTAMRTHRFSVPLLTEMDPALHTTRDSRTLGLNRNKGQAIELRLRTDAYDGYRDYRTIRNTLCHELAHCVFSEHDRDFWDLTARIEREVERSDWRSGGRSVTGQEFYNPGDWDRFQARGGDEVVDECGWTGGEFVLGGLSGSGSASGGVEGRREMLARAAEERLRKDDGNRKA